MCASFCSGTRILTARGRVRVEALRLGDMVVTVAHGLQPVRWIGRRIYNYSFVRANPNALPVRIKRGALDDNMPCRDLCLSPLHKVLIDGALIPAGALVNGSSIAYCEDLDPIEYYNIETPQHTAVLAEDLPAETYVDRGDRAMFMMARSSKLTTIPPAAAWAACAPIVVSGPVVERIKARIALRAGIIEADLMDRPQDGRLEGQVEWVDHRQLCGWAWLPDHPTEAVVLEVVREGEVIAISIADHFRGDLARLGIGNGYHAFHIELPTPLDPLTLHRLTLRRAADGKPLTETPLEVKPFAPSSALVGLDLSQLLAKADLSEARQVLVWLEQEVSKLRIYLSDDKLSATHFLADAQAALGTGGEARGLKTSKRA
ncbi:Hint domain-containing protein [Acidisoma sp. C75]